MTATNEIVFVLTLVVMGLVGTLGVLIKLKLEFSDARTQGTALGLAFLVPALVVSFLYGVAMHPISPEVTSVFESGMVVAVGTAIFVFFAVIAIGAGYVAKYIGKEYFEQLYSDVQKLKDL